MPETTKPHGRSLLVHFSQIKDSRQRCKVMYPLNEVLLLVVCGTMAACDDYDDIVLWGTHIDRAALTFTSAIEDPERVGHAGDMTTQRRRFARSSDVGAYAGLVPRRSQSGERDYKGRISKSGDGMLRHALYEAANSVLSRLKRPCALQTWGRKLAESKPVLSACKAVEGAPSAPASLLPESAPRSSTVFGNRM